MARDRRSLWGRLSRTLALYRFDLIQLDSIQFVPFRSDWLGVPNHGPGQATLLGTAVPNHGFVAIRYDSIGFDPIRSDMLGLVRCSKPWGADLRSRFVVPI